MSLHEELIMLKDSYRAVKSRLATAESKREYELTRDEMRVIRTQIAMCQAELRSGYSLQE